MPIAVKICGINSAPAMTAAITGGAAHVGLMFYPPSPRFLSLTQAAELAALVPDGITRVGVFVDAGADTIARTLEAVPLDVLQLHGHETADEITVLRDRFGLPVIRAIKLAGAADLATAVALEAVADMILFDALPPADMVGALPGGNALSFDWTLLKDYRGTRPWLLSGGLTAENLAKAIAVTGARIVDVSSGLESAPGVKNPAMIGAFLAAARGL
ncbi:MAG: phosphoribosylanthranilate isomerase [Alphaproteobacteria bacterium]|jgi:phosphoribosylanthranilate isomerase